jgi:arylsulfatase A-like enzyme
MSGVPSVRKGAWKLILSPRDGGLPKGDDDATVQLYNLANDLGETKNLADEQPERVAEMKALLEKLISGGRSTPGVLLKNDVAVRRFNAPTKSEK